MFRSIRKTVVVAICIYLCAVGLTCVVFRDRKREIRSWNMREISELNTLRNYDGERLTNEEKVFVSDNHLMELAVHGTALGGADPMTMDDEKPAWNLGYKRQMFSQAYYKVEVIDDEIILGVVDYKGKGYYSWGKVYVTDRSDSVSDEKCISDMLKNVTGWSSERVMKHQAIMAESAMMGVDFLVCFVVWYRSPVKETN